MAKVRIAVAWHIFLDSMRLLEDRTPELISVFNFQKSLKNYSKENIVIAVFEGSELEIQGKNVLAIGAVRKIYKIANEKKDS